MDNSRNNYPKPLYPIVVDPSKGDLDGDGHLDRHELKNLHPHLPDAHIDHAFRNADRDGDGRLNRHEYNSFQKRAYRFAKIMVLPPSERRPEGVVIDAVDGEYTDEYTCCPPPIFMPAISIVIIGIFVYHTMELTEKQGTLGINGPPPMDSVLIYNPYRRYEAWRFLSYMFVHSGWMHIASNVFMQLFLGILLEMVHKGWRVMIVYCAGVVAGSLATSISDPKVFLAGASGGVYALITAHMATVIMNWKEMEMPWIRVISFTAFTIMDVGTALYFRYVAEQEQKIGYVAHLGGALAGLLVGIYTLRNIKRTKGEDYLWWSMLVLSVVLFAFAISWNIFYTSWFPEPKYTLED